MRRRRAALGCLALIFAAAGGPRAQDPVPVRIHPGESVQAAVAAHPPGTTFILEAGIHRGQSVEPKDGTTFLGEPGAVMDGAGLTRFAVGHYGSGSRNVTIRGIEIRNYATPLDQGAIQGGNTVDWTVEENEVHHNGGYGISGGRGMRVRRNHSHHNGDVGIHGYHADGMLVEANRVHDNAALGIDEAPYATAAGMKFYQVRGLVVRGNEVHDNTGRGIWTDTDCIDVVIEGNRVTGNSGIGIWHEIGYRAVIRGNYVARNGFEDYSGERWLGGAGIAVSNSSDTEVTGNTVVGNADGIAGMQARGYPRSGAYGPYVLANLRVHDNVIVMDQGRTGIVQNALDRAVFDRRGNRFYRNRYTLGSAQAYFAWRNDSLDETGWRAAGHDVDGAFSRSR